MQQLENAIKKLDNLLSFDYSTYPQIVNLIEDAYSFNENQIKNLRQDVIKQKKWGLRRRDEAHIYKNLWHKNHLFDCMMEECVEVMELLYLEPENIEKTEQELNDLFAVYDLLFKPQLLKPICEKNKHNVLEKKQIDKEIFILVKNIHYYTSKAVRFLESDKKPSSDKTNSQEIRENIVKLLQLVDKSKDYRLWERSEMKAKKDKVLKHIDIGRANILKVFGI